MGVSILNAGAQRHVSSFLSVDQPMTTAQSVTNEELDQILQTIEMFEVILQSNAEDCQSMEILKEAYWKLNRQKDALDITRQLADTYYSPGPVFVRAARVRGHPPERP